MRKTRRMLSRMMAVLLALPFALSLLASCTGQQTTQHDLFDPPEIPPSKAPAGWSVLEGYGHPVEVTPSAIEKVPAKQINLPANQSDAFLKPLSDGGCLSVSATAVDGSEKSGNPAQILRVIRFQSDGIAKWERRFDSDPFVGFPAAICVFPDDGFALALRIVKDPAIGDYSDRLWRFSPAGNLLWQSTDEQIPAGALDHIFAATDGSVLAAGMATTSSSPGQGETRGIRLLRLDGGNLPVKEHLFETPGFNSLLDASQVPGSGIVLSWSRTNPEEKEGAGTLQRYGITCFDENLNLKWQTEMADGESLFEVQSLPGGETLAIGSSPDSRNVENPASMRSTLFCFDVKGMRQWAFTPKEANTWVRMATRLADGRFLIGVYHAGPEGEEATTLFEWGTGKKDDPAPVNPARTMDTVPGMVTQLVATRDGGCTIILRQTLRALPQPGYVSSIWTDTEAIVVHYDRNLKIAWRRTLDQYKHSLRLDLVIPTADDRLLIG